MGSGPIRPRCVSGFIVGFTYGCLGWCRQSASEGVEMGLAEDLSDVAIAFDCPDCAHPTVRKGSALRTIAHIRCDGCNAKVRITYPQKLAIFEKHRQLAARRDLGEGLHHADPDHEPLKADR